MQKFFDWKGSYAIAIITALMLGSGSAEAQDTAASGNTDNVAQEEAQSEPEPEKEVSWTDHLKLKGDLRYRFEIIDKEEKDLRYRHRIRARIGLHAKVVEDLNAVVQAGTGGADDPVSNNQTLTEAFSSKPLWLDLAYFDYGPSWAEGLHLIGGKHKNQFYKVGKTELLWDPDLNPEGLSLSYKNRFDMVEPFITGVGSFVEERKADDDTWLMAAQAGVKFNFLDDDLYILAGGGYYDYLNLSGMALLWDPEDSFGNTTISEVDDEGNTVLLYANDYNEAEGFVEVGGKLVGYPWAVFGDYVVNTDLSSNNTGWLCGASFGKLKEDLDFWLRYIYREVESDAVVGIFTDSDFKGGGTDGKGHEGNVFFQPVRHVQTGVTYFYNQTTLEEIKYYHRAQIDLKLKF